MELQIIESIEQMREISSRWSFSADVALVPTMGALHEGHLSLVREASRIASTVVVSIFVNPLQFGPAEDFDKYPRDLHRDASLLASAGAKIVFPPRADEITPPTMELSIDPGRMGRVLCGEYRPGHFAGVATIVSKLFNIVQPGCAIFGWKDAQQFLILRKMVQDFNIPVELKALDTIREHDGLAMSSRNSYLSDKQRQAATSIHRGLQEVSAAFKNGNSKSDTLIEIFKRTISAEPSLKLQYISVVSMDSLEPLDMVVPGNTLVALAVYAGETRLIDNIRL